MGVVFNNLDNWKVTELLESRAQSSATSVEMLLSHVCRSLTKMSESFEEGWSRCTAELIDCGVGGGSSSDCSSRLYYLRPEVPEHALSNNHAYRLSIRQGQGEV